MVNYRNFLKNNHINIRIVRTWMKNEKTSDLQQKIIAQQNSLHLEQQDIQKLPDEYAPIILARLLKLLEISSMLKIMAGFVIAAILIVALYVGKDILIPLALAILFGFLLNPLVNRLSKWGLPRIAAIILVVMSTLAVLGGAASYLFLQLSDLSQELPQYQTTIKQKLQSVQRYTQGPSVWDGAIRTVETVEHSIEQAPQQKVDKPHVQQVEVVGEEQTFAESAQVWADKILSPITTAGIVFVFAILILIDRKDLHDRLLKLFGNNLNVGTDALDEAAQRIGKYLRMQLIVNLSYGVPMAIGLWFIGVPAAIMWGMVAVVMRFVPYVGPLISAAFPIILAFAVDPSWNMVLWTIGLVLLLELITNNIIEPWLYGESTGLSTLAIMVAATFWTAIWGPIGLILSTPLTACILVLANYIPALAFVKILIGNEPALRPPERFYQRLVADDTDAAMEDAVCRVQQDLPRKAAADVVARKVIAFYDDVAVPAIQLFSESHNQRATAEHRLRMNQGLKRFNRDFQIKYSTKNAEAAKILCLGARWEIDVHSSAMLAHALTLKDMPATYMQDAILQTQTNILDELPEQIEVLCISLFHAHPIAQIRLILNKIRAKRPDLYVIFATWNCDVEQLEEKIQQRFQIDALVNDVNQLILNVEAFFIAKGEKSMTALLPEDEAERLATMQDLDLLNINNIPIYAQYIDETMQAFDVGYAQISWVDQAQVFIPESPLTDRTQALSAQYISRDESICNHVVYQNEDLIIEDIQRDPRFRNVAELKKNHIRFYAGVPLRNKKGFVLGSLCILDRQPKVLDEGDLDLLHALANDLMQTISHDKKRDEKLDDIQHLEQNTPNNQDKI